MKLKLGIILILGIILRLISLDQSFWLDEAVQFWASSSFSPKELFWEYLPGDFNPPLYHLLLHFWLKIFDFSEAGARLFSVILGVGCLGLIFKIGECLKKKTGWTAALLLATSPLHIYYSQELRMYILACFAFLLALWRFLAFYDKKSWLNSFFLAFCLVLMSFSHFLTLFTLPIFFLWGVKEEFSKKTRELKKLLLPFLVLIVSWFFYFPIFLKQLQTGLGISEQFPVWKQVVGSVDFNSLALLPVKFVIGRISIEIKILYGLIVSVLVFLFWGTALLGWTKKFKFKKLLWGLLVFPLVLGAVVSFAIPVFSYFRFLYLLPVFYLLIVIAKPPKTILKLMVAVNLICSFFYLFNHSFHRENWRAAVSWINERNKSLGAPVLIVDGVGKPFEYYDKNKNKIIKLSQLKEKEREIRSWPTVFLVSYSLPIFDPEGKSKKTLEYWGFKVWRGDSFNQAGVEEWKKQLIQ